MGAKTYGYEGSNGAVIIVSKRPDEPSAAFAEESVRDDRDRVWFRGKGLYGIPGKGGGFSGSQGGGRVPTQEQEDALLESQKQDLERIPLERFFVGAISSRLTADGTIDFTVYGVGDGMMAASSMLFNMRENTYKNLEAARALFRLSRSAQDSPGLMADPMPLCLIDGKAVVSYADVPQADRIATIVVYDSKLGAAKFGPRGANGVVDIVSTAKIPTSLERVKANAGNLVENYGIMSCLPAHPEEGLELTRGYIAGCGYLAGGIDLTDCEVQSAALAVVDGVVVPYDQLPLIRPSHMVTAEFVGDSKEITRYTDDPDVYEYMIRITTKHGIEAATAGVKMPKIKQVEQPAAEAAKSGGGQPEAGGKSSAPASWDQIPRIEMTSTSIKMPMPMRMRMPKDLMGFVSTMGMVGEIKRSVDGDFSRVPGALFLLDGRESTRQEIEKLMAESDRGKLFITIVKSREVVEKYGSAAEKGVVFVSTSENGNAIVNSFLDENSARQTYGISPGRGTCRVTRLRTKSGRVSSVVLEGVYQVHPETLLDGLYIIDGREASKEEVTANRWIKRIEIVQNPELVQKYGEKARDRVVFVTTAKGVSYIGASTTRKADGNLYVEDTGFGFRMDPGDFTPLVVVDGQVVRSNYIRKMDPQKIEWVRPVYGPVDEAKYGKAARDCNCLILIKTKA